MGSGKLWIKWGPGSVKSSAKAISKDYVKFKKELPTASINELFHLTLENRMDALRRFGQPTLPMGAKIDLLGQCENNLSKLIFGIMLFENPYANEALHNAETDLLEEMLDVIIETVNKYAPGA